MPRLLAILLAALLLSGAVPAIPGPSTAEAQVWHPKGREKRRPNRARPAPKKKPDTTKPAPNDRPTKKKPPTKPTAAPNTDDDLDEDVLEESPTPPSSKRAPRPRDADADDDDDGWGEAWATDDTDDDDAPDTPTKLGDLDAGQTLRLDADDSFDDVGATVTFDRGDLTADRAATDADTPGVTRLETLAMAFARLGFDTVHDPVPLTADGASAVGEDVISSRAHGRAEGITRFGERLKVKVAGRANADLSLDSDTNLVVERYEAEIWDTYADLYLPHLDIRFGKQIVAWGKVDLLSPNDVVNPRDLRRGFMENLDELRLPVLALSTRVYDGPFSFEALWIPVAPTNRFELLKGDYALLGPNAATDAERRVGALVATLADDPTYGFIVRPLLDIGREPDTSIETGELGASASVNLEKLDLAAYFLWGHERNPRIQPHPDLIDLFANTPPEMLTPQVLAERITELTMMGRVPVAVDYPRRIHVGGALAGRIEPLGLKLDVGYAPQGNTILVPPGAGPLLSQTAARPQLQATASIDYDRGTDFSIILEASHLRVFDVPPNLDVFQLSHDRLNLLGARLAWSRGPIALRFLGFLDPTTPSYALRPAIRLSGHDNLSVEIAALLFGGPSTSYAGIADRNDEILLTVQYGL